MKFKSQLLLLFTFIFASSTVLLLFPSSPTVALIDESEPFFGSSFTKGDLLNVISVFTGTASLASFCALIMINTKKQKSK